jgi:hypothetical protein
MLAYASEELKRFLDTNLPCWIGISREFGNISKQTAGLR